MDESDPAFLKPLRLDRTNSAATKAKSVTVGDYFQAVETFLSENEMERTVSSIFGKTGRIVPPENIDSISVFLEKHGEFYHPARIAIESGSEVWQFVLNVAVSDAGLKCARREFELLKRLAGEDHDNSLPRVYEYGEYGGVESSDGKRRFAMFTGDWFSGFHEFHISRDSSNKDRVRVWDPDDGACCLAESQARHLYREAARILASCFDLDTFEQIYPWSHAAGDFVVNLDSDRLRVKLITVRGYRVLYENDLRDLASLLGALFAFLADLSIKNRLDRRDGVGEIAWADKMAVEATIEGFFSGLGKKAKATPGFEDIPDYFALYLTSMDEPTVVEFFGDLVSSYPPEAPETDFVRDKIDSHARLFFRKARDFFASNA